jgi:hypothetical protein
MSRGALAAAALGFALGSAPGAGAQEVSVSHALVYEDEELDAALTVKAGLKHFNIFLAGEAAGPVTGWDFSSWDSLVAGTTAKGEAAGEVTFANLIVAGGYLVKPRALSRLENPVPTSYTSAAGSASVPAVGAASSLPGSLGNHPLGLSLVMKARPLPDTAVLGEGYWNRDGVAGGRILVTTAKSILPVAGQRGKSQAQVSVGGYSYSLAPKEETSWFLSTPYFAAGTFSSCLTEVTLRQPLFPRTPPALFYGAWGFAESPFGSYSPWGRAEIAFPFPLGKGVVTLKGKFFSAKEDFYTPKNALSPEREKTALNLTAAYPLGRAVSVTGGVAGSWDGNTGFYQTRAAFGVAGGGLSGKIHGFFNNWKAAEQQQDILLESDTAAGGGVTLAAALPFAKFTLTGSYKLYPKKFPQELKDEYSASLAASPRIKAPRGKDAGAYAAIPDLRLRYDGRRNTKGASGEVTASASWTIRQRGLSVRVKVEGIFAAPE